MLVYYTSGIVMYPPQIQLLHSYSFITHVAAKDGDQSSSLVADWIQGYICIALVARSSGFQFSNLLLMRHRFSGHVSFTLPGNF